MCKYNLSRCKGGKSMEKTKYKISELAEVAGVTVRTIRYYVSCG